MSQRNINTCIREYAKNHQIEYTLKPQDTLTEMPQEKLLNQATNWPPTLKPSIYNPTTKEKDEL